MPELTTMSRTMKSVICKAELPPKVEIKDIAIPDINDNQILIKVIVSGSNPKDWKVPGWLNRELNEGDDIAGEVEAVGKNIRGFHKGDRVAAFHQMGAPGGSYAEYGVAEQHCTFHLPSSTSFEEAATFPLAYLTSVHGMFLNLRLPTPLRPATEEIPLLVYGASTAIGAFAIKLANLANIHPIIGVAGSGAAFAKEIGCDIVIDHREGKVVEQIKKALGGKKLLHAFDGVSEESTIKDCFAVLSQGGSHAYFLQEGKPPAGIRSTRTVVSYAQEGSPSEQDVAATYLHLLSKWLGEGRFKAHPYEVVPGGLSGVQKGLTLLYENKVSAKKLVFRVAETPGL